MGGTARQRGVLKKVGAIYLIMLAGLIHGLLYVFLLPPWQHYDEPGHFEYAWLLANRLGLPSPGKYDQSMRREVAASMVEHAFFKYLDIRPNLLDQNTPVWIGSSQTNDPIGLDGWASRFWVDDTGGVFG